MTVGEEIKIKNKSGILNVTLTKELSLKDVSLGVGDDKLPLIREPRVEYHLDPFDNQLITVFDMDQKPDCNNVFDIYIIYISNYHIEEPKVFLGKFEEGEVKEAIFETIY